MPGFYPLSLCLWCTHMHHNHDHSTTSRHISTLQDSTACTDVASHPLHAPVSNDASHLISSVMARMWSTGCAYLKQHIHEIGSLALCMEHLFRMPKIGDHTPPSMFVTSHISCIILIYTCHRTIVHRFHCATLTDRKEKNSFSMHMYAWRPCTQATLETSRPRDGDSDTCSRTPAAGSHGSPFWHRACFNHQAGHVHRQHS